MQDLPTRGLQSRGVELRPAGDGDDDLIRRILALAMAWRDAVPPTDLPASVDSYHVGWNQPDDLGVVAFDGIEFVGGAYVRRVTPADGTYGYISEAYPELTIGVEQTFRRRGIGVLCLAAVQARVIERGIAGISLSVEPDNRARLLYTKLGFGLVEDRGGDLLMLWKSPVSRAPV